MTAGMAGTESGMSIPHLTSREAGRGQSASAWRQRTPCPDTGEPRQRLRGRPISRVSVRAPKAE